MISLILSMFLISPFGGQTSAQDPDIETRVKQIVQQLKDEKIKRGCTEKNGECWELDSFINTLNSGNRGDGVRRDWMSKMQELGVKQAEFNFEFSWHKECVRYKFKQINYFRKYYVPKSRVVDRKLLRRIKDEGLSTLR